MLGARGGRVRGKGLISTPSGRALIRSHPEDFTVDAARRERILTEARGLGPEKFNRLVASVAEVRAQGRLRFWQEQLIARLAELTGLAIVGPSDFIAAFEGVEPMPQQPRSVKREEFFARPNYWYYLGGASIPEEWIAEAWERISEFRDNVTYEFEREASKVGDLDALTESLQFLDGILPLRRMVEIYERVRERSPHREPEFRPTFERVFGRRMADFPAPLPRLEHDEPQHPFSYGVPGPATDDEIPF